MRRVLSHPDWAIRAQAALTTCGLIFFGCGGVAVDDAPDADEASGDSQYDVVTRGEPADSEPELDVWLSDDVVEGRQPGIKPGAARPDVGAPGAEGTPGAAGMRCGCPESEYGIALLGPGENIVFNRPLDEPWIATTCGRPSAIFDACGVPIVLGACHDTEGCVLFTQDAAGPPTFYRYNQNDGGVSEVQGDSLDLTVNDEGNAVSGILEFKTSTALYQGSYRFCAPDRDVCGEP